MSTSRALATGIPAATPERIAGAALAAGCRSLAYTYNDPVVFLEYARDTAAAGRALGLRNVAVTAGYIQDAARECLFALMDAANVDLKAFSERFYRTLCGARLAPVLDTLRYIRAETSTWLEVTTLLIPGANDSERELNDLCAWIVEHLGPDVPLHFTAFHPAFRLRDRPATPAATLGEARRIARAQGLRHVYIGNLRDAAGARTDCARCGQPLIGRDGYRVCHWALTAAGTCPACGTPCPGLFEAQPGTWGERRLPLSSADLARV